MALLVKKFGGTSVGDISCIHHVTDIIAADKDAGHDVVIVVSAMRGETDRLVDLAKGVAEKLHPREFDALLSTGEQVSASLLSMSLLNKNLTATSFNAAQATIKTDSTHRKANILSVDPQKLQEALNAGAVPVVTGFQGVDEHGRITTLGRGGSDMTAVAIAQALNADECQIYTDVEGVFTTDPRVVHNARRLDQITFDEMMELSNLGAKVLQIRAVELANKCNVPLRVLSTFSSGPGTLITFENTNTDTPSVSGIALDRNQAKLTLLGLPNEVGVVSNILSAMVDANIEVDMMVQNVPSHQNRIDFSFTVHLDDYKEASDIMSRLSQTLHAIDVVSDDRIAKLSLVGVGMTTHAGVAAKMLQALDRENIPVQLITSSEIKISVVIDEKYMELGARILHTEFELEQSGHLD